MVWLPKEDRRLAAGARAEEEGSVARCYEGVGWGSSGRWGERWQRAEVGDVMVRSTWLRLWPHAVQCPLCGGRPRMWAVSRAGWP